MKMQFLCKNHRSQLEINESKAIHFWQVGFDTGHYFRDLMLWMDAIPHLGCAFETAEILLSRDMIEHNVACELFAKSALLLASTFSNLGHLNEAERVCWMAINRLERELANHPSNSEPVNVHLRDLYTQLEELLTTEQPTAQEGRDTGRVSGLTLHH